MDVGTCMDGRTDEVTDIWKDIFSAIHYGLDGLEIESRWGRGFRTSPGRPWGPPSLIRNGYQFIPGGKRGPGHGNNRPPRSSAEVKYRTLSSIYKTAYTDACKNLLHHNCIYNRISENEPSSIP
jgi:hypothetical protein